MVSLSRFIGNIRYSNNALSNQQYLIPSRKIIKLQKIKLDPLIKVQEF